MTWCFKQIHLQSQTSIPGLISFPAWFTFPNPQAPSQRPPLGPTPFCMQVAGAPKLTCPCSKSHLCEFARAKGPCLLAQVSISPTAERHRGSQRSWLRRATQAQLCCWGLPWVAQKSRCCREAPGSFLQLSSGPPHLQNLLHDPSWAISMGRCPSSSTCHFSPLLAIARSTKRKKLRGFYRSFSTQKCYTQAAVLCCQQGT